MGAQAVCELLCQPSWLVLAWIRRSEAVCHVTTPACNGRQSHYYLIRQTNDVSQRAIRPRQSPMCRLFFTESFPQKGVTYPYSYIRKDAEKCQNDAPIMYLIFFHNLETAHQNNSKNQVILNTGNLYWSFVPCFLTSLSQINRDSWTSAAYISVPSRLFKRGFLTLWGQILLCS